MDIKAPLSKYQAITNKRIETEKIKESIDTILNSKIDHEFRTTVTRELITENDLIEIAETIARAKKYYLQIFIPSKTLSTDEQFSSYSKEEMERIAKNLKRYVDECLVR